MQSGWLKHYFVPQHSEQCQHHIIENQYLEELAQDRVYEFAWSFNPLPLVGATGSPGNSVALA